MWRRRSGLIGMVVGRPPSRSVTRNPASVITPTRSPSAAASRKLFGPGGNGTTAEQSSSRLCRCRHSQPRSVSGAASKWRAASATSWFSRAAPAAASEAR